MERLDRPSVATFFCEEALEVGEVRLRGAPAQHARVRRIGSGDAVHLANGHGRIAIGTVDSIGKDALTVSVQRIVEIPRPTPLDVVVPVADKERMLLAAEKCVELQVTSWRPAYFARSRSVATRGEGDKFRQKLTARMQAALEQSGAAWLPDLHDEQRLGDALASVAEGSRRLILDVEGEPIAAQVWNGPMAIAVGPEGGLERAELADAQRGGWIAASLAAATLRFETAIIAGAAVIRSAQLPTRSA